MFDKETIDSNIIFCTRCELSELVCNDNTLPQLGFGKLVSKESSKNDIMIVGLNPSRNRYEGLRYPFAGGEYFKNDRSGYKFLNIFKELGVFDRCYIANLVKCSTKDNKVKKKNMLDCFDHLINEMKYCNPRVILAVGSQVDDFLRTNYISAEKIYHPSYCFSYHGIKEQDYKDSIKNILKLKGIL